MVLPRDRVSVWADEKVLGTDDGPGCTTRSVGLMSLKCTHLKMVKLRSFMQLKEIVVGETGGGVGFTAVARSPSPLAMVRLQHAELLQKTKALKEAAGSF